MARVGLIGFGNWGRNIARNLHAMGALAAIHDSDPERLEEARELFPSVVRVASLEELLARTGVQAVVIAAPAPAHAALARQALRAGCDLLVEKPFSLTLADGRELVERARDLGRVLMVGHVLEYHPAVVQLKGLVDGGALGKVEYVYSSRMSIGRFRTEENALWSFAPHDVAVFLRLIGAMPVSVTCSGEAFLTPRVADVTLTTMSFRGQILGHILVSWLHPLKVHRLVVVGDRQMAVFDDTQPWASKLTLYPHQVRRGRGGIPVAQEAEGIPVRLEEAEPLRLELQHFLDRLRDRGRPLTDGESALRVLEVLEAAQRSLDQGWAPVCLDGARTSVGQNGETYVHPTAVIDPGARLGEGCSVWHFSHVMGGARLGSGSVLGQNVFVGRDVRIGRGVKIQNNVSVYEGVTLEDHVFCGPSMVFTNVVNPRSEIERKQEFAPTLVRRGATLGANCTVMCGVTVGRYAFVAAGAVVTHDVPDHALVMGVPARPAGWMCECGVKLLPPPEASRSSCSACGRAYRLQDGRLERADEGSWVA